MTSSFDGGNLNYNISIKIDSITFNNPRIRFIAGYNPVALFKNEEYLGRLGILEYKSGIDYNIGTGATYIRFANCSPDWEWFPSEPETQSVSKGIINVTNNGSIMGIFDIKITGTLNENWTLYASNQSDLSQNLTLNSSYQRILGTVHAGETKKIFLFANCSYISSNPGVSLNIRRG